MELISVEYAHNGANLVGQLAVPKGGGRRPAVLVMHDARGFGKLPVQRIQDLAEMGYVGFASDMYGGGKYFGELEGGVPMLALHDQPEVFRSRVVACFETLKARPEVDPDRIAAIGYCFGGQCVLELARSGADVKVVASYHGLLTTSLPAQPGTVKAEVAVFCGGKDPYAPREHIASFEQEMQDAGAHWQLSLYNEAFHAFTDPNAAEMVIVPGVKYDPMADKLSWAATKVLLEIFIGT